MISSVDEYSALGEVDPESRMILEGSLSDRLTLGLILLDALRDRPRMPDLFCVLPSGDGTLPEGF